MRSSYFWLAALALLAACGCAGAPAPLPPPAVESENPALMPVADLDFLWNTTVDVVDDYFTIDREEPVRQLGDVLTEGRIDTFPEIGSTVFEPWRGDSANAYQRWESTLQSIRRQAIVRVVPASGGFLIDVAVFKELEDVPRPERSTVGAATLRHDNSLNQPTPIVGERLTSAGWIPVGRDMVLEQRILGQLKGRLGVPITAITPLPAQPMVRPLP
ncbi:MAG: hypothetical protein HUU35_01580 [Armatimonadetes bacterium]|nr:hypothetical protein [Armatimonadota bacterium]